MVRGLCMLVIGVLTLGLSPILQASQDQVLPAGQSVEVEYLLSDSLVSVVDTLTLTRRIINGSDQPFVGLYLSDNLPSAFIVRQHSAELNGVPTASQYQVLPPGTVVSGYNVHYWVFDEQAPSGVDLVLEPNDTLVLTIKVTCAFAALYTLPLHTLVCYNSVIGGLFAAGTTQAVRFGIATDVGGDDDRLPGSYLISTAYPNPFNGAVTISYSGAFAGDRAILLEVYNQLGQTVYRDQRNLGSQEGELEWEPAPGTGSGVYFYRLSAGTSNSRGKLILVK
jgi:hypothetical protein